MSQIFSNVLFGTQSSDSTNKEVQLIAEGVSQTSYNADNGACRSATQKLLCILFEATSALRIGIGQLLMCERNKLDNGLVQQTFNVHLAFK